MNTLDDRNRPSGAPQSQSGAGQGAQLQQGAGRYQSGATQAQQYSPGAAQQQGGAAAGGQPAQQAGYGTTLPDRAGPAPRATTPSLFSGRGGPFDMLRRLDEDMDRLFQQFWGGRRGLMRRSGGDVPSMWAPQVDVCERDGKLHVYADLPGLRREDVKVSMEGDQLVLEGERRSEHEEGQPGGGFFHSERSYGTFYRSIPLPEGVDPQTADASFRDGVLDVCFDAPKTMRQQRRQIDVRDGSQASPGASGSKTF